MHVHKRVILRALLPIGIILRLLTRFMGQIRRSLWLLWLCLSRPLGDCSVCRSSGSTLLTCGRRLADFLFISLCLGTGTMYSSLMRIRWLPSCHATWKPAFARTLTTSRQESRGSLDNYFNLFSPNLAMKKLCFDFQAALYSSLDVF